MCKLSQNTFSLSLDSDFYVIVLRFQTIHVQIAHVKTGAAVTLETPGGTRVTVLQVSVVRDAMVRILEFYAYQQNR